MIKVKSGKKNNWITENKHLLIPSLIGAFLAWLFSGDEILAVAIFVGVWIGNKIGYSMKKK